MNIEKLTQYIETVWLDERSSLDQKRNKTTYAIQQHLNQAQLQQHPKCFGDGIDLPKRIFKKL
jgi:hypothetical protein